MIIVYDDGIHMEREREKQRKQKETEKNQTIAKITKIITVVKHHNFQTPGKGEKLKGEEGGMLT